MKILLGAAMLAATAISAVNGAQAAKLCKLTGTYTDEYGIATAIIKGAKGQLVAPEICATPYTFKISDETKTGFNVKGGNKTKSCGTFSASLTFMGSCDVFGGTATVHGMKLSDVFTKQDAAQHSVPDQALSLGLK